MGRGLGVDRLWFRARSFGWGWTPVTVEGWLVLGVFLVGVAVDIAVFTRRLQSGGDPRPATVTFLVWLAILSGALVAICWMTGERPRWRWGR